MKIDLHTSMESELRESLGLDKSWVMRDLPWMRQKYYEQLMDAIGENNFRFVSGSSRTLSAVGGNTAMIRATLFVNQQGLANIRAFAETLKT